MAKEYVEITIRYERGDPDISIDEEIEHWKKGNIDVPTITDGCDEECTVTGKIVELA